MDISSVMNALVEVPMWWLNASALFGAIVGMSFLLLAIVVLRREPRASQKANETEATTPKPVGAPAPRTVADPGTVKQASETAPAPSMPRASAPPIKQHYWYYVDGVKGRFATLREALPWAGVILPESKPLDWKKLPPDTRSKIQRVEVGSKAEAKVADEGSVDRSSSAPPSSTPSDEPASSVARSSRDKNVVVSDGVLTITRRRK